MDLQIDGLEDRWTSKYMTSRNVDWWISR